MDAGDRWGGRIFGTGRLPTGPYRDRSANGLRISAWFEHPESQHTLESQHHIEGRGGRLTENLHTYAPFRLFTTETQIRYGETQALPAKK